MCLPIRPDSSQKGTALRPESRTWVDASLSKKSAFDWRELVIKGMFYTGGLNIARRLSRIYEIRPNSTLPLFRFRRVKQPRHVILCYHGIGESGNPLTPAPTLEKFESQMRFLRENYRIVSIEQAWNELRQQRVCEPGVSITFDDGYSSAYTVAYPVLKGLKIPATIFLTVDSIETGQVAWYDRVFLAMAVAPSGELRLEFGGPWRFQIHSKEDRMRAALETVAHLRTLPDEDRKIHCSSLERVIGLPANALSSRILNWEQIREMQGDGISFGSHTLTHPVVSQLSADGLARELGESKKILETKLQVPVFDFAFPFGKTTDWTAAAIKALSQYGYRSAVSTVPGVNTPGTEPFELRRLQVGHDWSLARFAFDLSQAFLKAEDPATLTEPMIGTTTFIGDQMGSSIGGSFGGPDA
jgi:peptidoglycan/xylan/chitin deacetylase (PgdA/CDA1 family)